MRIITRNLAPDFARHLVVFQTTADFKTFYEAGLAVEDALRMGIFEKAEKTETKNKKVYSGNSRTLFGNYQNSSNSNSNNQKSNETKPVNQINTQPNKPRRQFHQFANLLSSVYQKLLEKKLIKPLEPRELPKELPANHNPNAFCDYHQMPGHYTNNCFCLRHQIQDLIDNETLPIPPKPNTIANPMPEYKPNNQISHISTQSDHDSTKFNPNHYIVSETDLKPIVQVPNDSEVNFLEGMVCEWTVKWGDLVDEWLEREATELHVRNLLEPGNEIRGALQNNDEWLMAYVDHESDNNQVEWEWDPKPNEWQMMEEIDSLDYVTLPLLFTNYEYECAYDQPGLRLFGQPPENLEDLFGNIVKDEYEWDVTPTEYQLIKQNDPLDTFSLSHLFGHETRVTPDEIDRQYQAMNALGEEFNLDPSKFIVPDTEPKPIVYVPEEPEVLFFESFEMEHSHSKEGWTEGETIGFLMGGEPIVDNENWGDFV